MKKILLALIAVTFITSFFIAAGPSANAEEVKTFIGTIQSFPHGPGHFKSGPPLWPFGMIVVAADNGEKNNFLVVGEGPNATTFYDADGKAATVAHIKVEIGTKVEVKYTITEQSMRYLNKALAISVRYVPTDYVQQPAISAAQGQAVPQLAAQSKNVLIGKVEDIIGITPGLLNNWTYSKIIVVADTGNESVFFINKNTALINEDGITNPPLPKKNQRVEVKYSITDKGVSEAISIKYLPEQQPAANADESKIFVGKIERSGGALRYWWKFTAVADNGEKKEFRVPRGGSTIIQIDGKQRYGEAPRRGRKIEVKYSVTERGDNVTTSMRYVPLDYVQQLAASTVQVNATSETAQPTQQAMPQPGDVFIGKVEFVRKMLPRPPYWRMALLTVIADSGERKEIDIVGDTAVTDAAGKDMGKGRGAWKLKNGERIEIKYTPAVNNGHDKAVSIHCLD